MIEACQRATARAPWASSFGAGPVQVSIDPNGNLTGKTEGTDTWGYEWNANNELTRVTKNSVEQARFSYDANGRRVEKVTEGVTTSYTYDGDDILREVRGSDALKYVHGQGIDEPLAVDGGSSVSYLHADGLSSVVIITNAAGTVTSTRQYDAWGSLEVGAAEPGYAYTGREWDPEINLYYYRARYYDPRGGRFVREDPLGLAGGSNLYRYVGNNPVNLVDPSGLQSCPGNCMWMGGGAVGAIGWGAGATYELGICKGNCGWSVRQRFCVCSVVGLGGSLGKLGVTMADTSAKQQGWCVATPKVTVSGSGWVPNSFGVGPGVGVFYLWCDCTIKEVL